MLAYVSIGNSDNKLTHDEWAQFYALTDELVRTTVTTRIYGAWHSLPAQPWVNACWAIDVPDEHVVALKSALRHLAKKFRQDSIAWAEAPHTEFLSPTPGPGIPVFGKPRDER